MAPLINFRDIAESINNAVGTKVLSPGLIYRSARPDYSDERELARLKDEYKISTLLDLRTNTERLERPAPSPCIASLGLKCRIVDFNGRAYTWALMKQLSYWQSTQLITRYTFGYRKEAISVLSKNVLAKRGLIGLAEDSLSSCKAEIKAVFDLLSDEAESPMLIHCTQGKDRTGLVVLLVLMLLDVPVDAIAQDYMASQKELRSEREGRLKELSSIGLPDAFADCEPSWPATIVTWIEQEHGGIVTYLEHCGVGQEAQSSIRARLMAAKA